MNKGYCADIPFSKARDQEAALTAHGIDPLRIYCEGRDAETFATCRDALRVGDKLFVSGSLRVFGLTRAVIVSRIREIHDKQAVVIVAETGQRSDKHGLVMLDEALKGIHGSRKMKDSKKFAKRIGRKGGKAKYDAMAAQRLPELLAKPIWLHPKLTIAEKLDLMNPVDESGNQIFARRWTEATARRHLAGST